MKLKLYVIVLCSLLFSTQSYGKERTRKDVEKTFYLSFFDTTYTQKIKLTLNYDDNQEKPYQLTFNVDSTVADTVKMKTKTVQFEEPMKLNDLESELNKIVIQRYSVPRTITQYSVYEIFYWIFTATHYDTARPVSGILKLGSYVKYYKDSMAYGYFKFYSDERQKADRMVDKYKYTAYKSEVLQKQLSDFKYNDSSNILMERLANDTVTLNSIIKFVKIGKKSFAKQANKYTDEYPIKEVHSRQIDSIAKNIQLLYGLIYSFDILYYSKNEKNSDKLSGIQYAIHTLNNNFDSLYLFGILNDGDGKFILDIKAIKEILKSKLSSQKQSQQILNLFKKIEDNEIDKIVNLAELQKQVLKD